MDGRVAGDLALRQGAREGEYPLWIFKRRATPQQRQRSRNPPGWVLAGTWRRCSSVAEPCGYAPSSRIARRPSELSAPSPYLW